MIKLLPDIEFSRCIAKIHVRSLSLLFISHLLDWESQILFSGQHGRQFIQNLIFRYPLPVLSLSSFPVEPLFQVSLVPGLSTGSVRIKYVLLVPQ